MALNFARRAEGSRR